MSNKKAKEALSQMKQEAANTVGVNLKQGYNGDITARQAGSIGGEMVKRMIESYENGQSASLPSKNQIPKKSAALHFAGLRRFLRFSGACRGIE